MLRASASTDLNLAVLLVTLAEWMSRGPELPSVGTTTENGDLERGEGEGEVESEDVDNDVADDRDGVRSVDTDVERDVADECDGRGCRRRRFARLGTVSQRALFLGGPRTGDNLRTQLPTMSSHSHSPAFSVHM